MSNDDTNETYYDMDNDGIDTEPDWKSEIFDANGSLECPLCGNEYLSLVKSRYPKINHKGDSGAHVTCEHGLESLGWYGKIEPHYICPNCYERETEEHEVGYDGIHHHNLTEEMLEQYWDDWDNES